MKPAANERIVRIIRKLSEIRVDRGATPAEAIRAAAKIEQLLEEHQLSLFDVQSNTFDEVVGTETIDLGPRRRIPQWVHNLAQAVARPHDCDYFVRKRWTKDKGQQSSVHFIGHKSDALVASYLYAFLSRELLEMADTEGRRLGRTLHGLITFKQEFMIAAAREVFNRLYQEKKVVRGDSTASHALVPVKKAAVERYMKAHHASVRTTSPRADTDHDRQARALGAEAGRNVPLKQGIDDQQGQPLGLPHREGP